MLSLDGRREVNDAFRKTVAGTGSYDTIVPKFKALVDERENLDYYARGITRTTSILPRMC